MNNDEDICEQIDSAAHEIWKLPTLDEASTELAEKLGERYEERLAMQKRIIEGLSPRGRLRRNAPCPCGSGRKFKNCCYRDFLNKKHGRNTDPIETPNERNDRR